MLLEFVRKRQNKKKSIISFACCAVELKNIIAGVILDSQLSAIAVKGEKLLTYSCALIYVQRFLFFIKALAFWDKCEYYVITLFSKTAYYLNKLSRALKLVSF